MVINYNNLEEGELLHKFLGIINAAQLDPEKRLTPLETRLLVEFLKNQDKGKYFMFSPAGKKKVFQALKEEGWEISKVNMNNKIYSMVEKGLLKRDTDGVIMVAQFIVEGTKKLLGIPENGSYEITFRFSNTNANSN